MDIVMTGRHVEITPALKRYIRQRAQKIEKYAPKVGQVFFTLKTEKYRSRAEVVAHVDGRILQVEEETDEMLASIDKALTRLESRLKRYKDRRARPPKEEAKTIRRPARRAPAIATLVPVSKIQIRTRQTIARMTLVEAEERIETQTEGFLFFVEQANRRLHLLYRRQDGALGLIEAEPEDGEV